VSVSLAISTLSPWSDGLYTKKQYHHTSLRSQRFQIKRIKLLAYSRLLRFAPSSPTNVCIRNSYRFRFRCKRLQGAADSLINKVSELFHCTWRHWPVQEKRESAERWMSSIKPVQRRMVARLRIHRPRNPQHRNLPQRHVKNIKWITPPVW